MAQSRGKGNYVINTFNGMAYGFFASLIIGTILTVSYTHLRAQRH